MPGSLDKYTLKATFECSHRDKKKYICTMPYFIMGKCIFIIEILKTDKCNFAIDCMQLVRDTHSLFYQ